MERSKAQSEFVKLMKETESSSIQERSYKFAHSPFPEVDLYFWEYIYGKIEPKEFEDKCVRHIQISDTKLYQVLK